MANTTKQDLEEKGYKFYVKAGYANTKNIIGDCVQLIAKKNGEIVKTTAYSDFDEYDGSKITLYDNGLSRSIHGSLGGDPDIADVDNYENGNEVEISYDYATKIAKEATDKKLEAIVF